METATWITAYSTLSIAIITAIYAGLTGYLIVFVRGQVREMRRQLKEMKQQLIETKRMRQVSTFSSLKKIRSPKSARTRGRIYDAYCENPEQFSSRENLSRSPELHAICKEVVYDLSEIGILIHHKLLDSVIAKDWLQIIPAKMWVILRDYIKEGEYRREQDNYGIAFKYVARLGIDYWFESKKTSNLKDMKLVIFPSSKEPLKNKVEYHFDLSQMLQEIENDLIEYGWMPKK